MAGQTNTHLLNYIIDYFIIIDASIISNGELHDPYYLFLSEKVTQFLQYIVCSFVKKCKNYVQFSFCLYYFYSTFQVSLCVILSYVVLVCVLNKPHNNRHLTEIKCICLIKVKMCDFDMYFSM